MSRGSRVGKLCGWSDDIAEQCLSVVWRNLSAANNAARTCRQWSDIARRVFNQQLCFEVVPLSVLPEAIKHAISGGRTPLVIDRTGSGAVNTFFEHGGGAGEQSYVCLRVKPMVHVPF